MMGSSVSSLETSLEVANTKVSPGAIFPEASLPLVGGERISLRAMNEKPKLLVFYRGSFCPFCRGTLTEINSKLDALEKAGIEVVAISADRKDVAEALVAELKLTFPVAYGLEEADIYQLGLYASDPTNYIPQTHRFTEPGYFLLSAENQILYAAISSHPMGGRVNVDHLIAGYQYRAQRAKDEPAFGTVIWGAVSLKSAHGTTPSRLPKLLPGSTFPEVSVPLPGGGNISLSANGKPRLIIVYRGVFCPFCKGTLAEVNKRLASLKKDGNWSLFDVVAISADSEEVTKALVQELDIIYPVAYGLQEAAMFQLGLYVSDPTHYIPQTNRFSEPAYIFLTTENKIQYISLASHPMGGRVNLDHLIAGYQYSLQRTKEEPAFGTVIWGSALPNYRK